MKELKDNLKRINIINLFNNQWIIAILLMPFIKPATELTGKLDIIFDLIKIINCTIIIFSYIYILKKPSKIILLISVLELIYMLSTILNQGRIWWGGVQVISIISLSCLLEVSLRVNKKTALNGFCIAAGFMAFATIISMFAFYPRGMYTVTTEHNVPGLWHIPEKSNYLWGFDNSSVFKFIPVLTIFLLNTDFKNRKSLIITFLMIGLSVTAFIYVKSITAALACLIFMAYYIVSLLRKNKPIRFLNYRNCMIFIIVIFITLILANKNITVLQNIASKTDKVVSLNYRFKIWNNSIKEFTKNPLIGYGFEERLVTAHKIGIDHPHNIFLDVMYRGGIFGVIVYATILAKLGKKVMKKSKSNYSNIISIGFLALFLVGQMDYYNEQYLLFTLFILAYNSDVFMNMNNTVQSKNRRKAKVGILTFQDTVNYGAMLQTYALQKYINNNQIPCEVINYKNDKLEQVERPMELMQQRTIKGVLKYFKCHEYQVEKWNKFQEFKKNNIRTSEEIYTSENKGELKNKYESIIVGSDQVWNTEITGNDYTYYLDFMEDDKRKHSYAASFGFAEWPKKEKENIIRYLQSFNTINIREKRGKELIGQELPEKKVNIVVDPTLLLTKKEWERFVKKEDKNYIVVYMIDFKKEVFDFIKKLAHKSNCKIIYVHDAILSQIGMKNSRDDSVEQFLNWIYNAKYVVTGSFHALCMSLIYEKQFYYTLNSKSNKNSRLENLIEMVGLEDRRVVNGVNDTITDINYKKVNQKLQEKINESKEILKIMLGEIKESDKN